MDKLVKKRRGGPRTFDRDHAVDTAMRLFWRHGYEGVSLNDLTAAIGIAPPSLYAAFGSKAGLYREALDRYSGLPTALNNLGQTTSLCEAVETLLKNAIEAVTEPGEERGCMISSGMIQCGEDHADLARELAERRGLMRDSIMLKLQPWVDRDRAVSLSRYLVTILQGLSVQARDGASREELKQVAGEVAAGIKGQNLSDCKSGTP
ncbi:TetR/AcrR family transcriptional regulator [Phyllobacterium myrsinacearum]|jgi:AcrR family transcriptional regulator|uniref:TetR/AcrR family transcriptional regulator n=1 Tax=Phyllobacterium myrsinacearum TaxID=28101 RepID=A0A2S9JGV6_9HYPH|nr:TetR/AcrR family transcriptional regulator [Phyllobacterium myrsinacearum]PRD52215.1 TetR/AcrR family transcriptional regulator [Phyllobacterium myrsinacearum]PWV83731.1 TetR family transcriptional regulator [Phyllobacterium myrsinacearum]RZV04746.1 TetR family transcriptional regulator [Phyllobacterium myrsinacearum]